MNFFFGALALLIVVGILFVSHWIVFVSAIPLLNPDLLWQKKALLITLLMLGGSFMVASLVAHAWENNFTRAWYSAAGIWLGVLTNLVLAFSVVWAIVGLSAWFGWGMVPIRVLSWVGVGIAVLVSLYGVWAAATPAVTRVTVRIPNLPESWRGKTIIQLSDIHIGHVHREQFLAQVVAQVNDLHPKLVVITGDLFDGMDGVLEKSILPLNDLRSEQGTLFVTGNHETYLGVERSLGILQHTTVKILYDEVIDIDGLKVIGIDYPKPNEQKNMPDVLRSLQTQFVGQPNVLLFHSPISIQTVKQLGVNLFLAGHTHRGQLWPFRYITWIIYHGYDYGLHVSGDFSIFTSSGVGTWGPPLRTGTQSEIVAITLE